MILEKLSIRANTLYKPFGCNFFFAGFFSQYDFSSDFCFKGKILIKGKSLFKGNSLLKAKLLLKGKLYKEQAIINSQVLKMNKLDIKIQTNRTTKMINNINNVNIFYNDFELGMKTTQQGEKENLSEARITLRLNGSEYEIGLNEFKEIIQKRVDKK